MTFDIDPRIVLTNSDNLYKWSRVWANIQKRYYPQPVEIRRVKQVVDFVRLNGFKKIYLECDKDIFDSLPQVPEPSHADLVVISDQTFSRRPCPAIIEKMQTFLSQCPRMFVCLNRHYINIDNSYHDDTVSDDFLLAITQWLKKSLPDHSVIDLSLDYVDRGDHFTWVVPDRLYYIESKK